MPEAPSARSQALERVLALAATDTRFAERLLARRWEALDDPRLSGLVLGHTERSMLEALPAAQLQGLVDALGARGDDPRDPAPCVPIARGISPDIPPGRTTSRRTWSLVAVAVGIAFGCAAFALYLYVNALHVPLQP